MPEIVRSTLREIVSLLTQHRGRFGDRRVAPATESGPKVEEMTSRIFSTFSGRIRVLDHLDVQGLHPQVLGEGQGRLPLDDAVWAPARQRPGGTCRGSVTRT